MDEGEACHQMEAMAGQKQHLLKKKQGNCLVVSAKCRTFAPQLRGKPPIDGYMVTIVQLVRASDCGSECRGFESH